MPLLVEKSTLGRVDFQWPNDYHLLDMIKKEELRMKQIEVWYDSNHNLSGVRVTLSNGEQSPYFKTEHAHQGPQILKID